MANADHYLLGTDKDSWRRYVLFNEIYHPGTAQRLAALSLKPDMHILEIGCGIGRTACHMANQVVPDGHVTALDQSAALVELAERHALDTGTENVTFVCSKAQAYAYPEEAFEFAHTRFVLSYSPFAAEILASTFDALKPSGIFLGEEISQVYVTHNPPRWFEEIVRWFPKLIEIGGGDPDYGLHAMPSEMLVAGFRDLRVTAYCPVENQRIIAEMLRLSLSHEMRSGLVDGGIASAEEVDRVVAEAADPVADDSLISSCMAIQIAGRKLGIDS